MSIFYRLVLAHVIADFPLQFGMIYRFKKNSPVGSFCHSGIFAVVSIITVFPYWGIGKLWAFIFFLWIIHGVQDWTKVVLSDRYNADNLWVFLLDQILHIGFISLLFPLGLDKVFIKGSSSTLTYLWSDNLLVTNAILFLSLGFGGGIFVSYIKNLFYHGTRFLETSPQSYIQVGERLVITASVLLGGGYRMLIAGVWILHLGYTNFALKNPSRFSSCIDLLLNTAVAGGIPFILKLN